MTSSGSRTAPRRLAFPLALPLLILLGLLTGGTVGATPPDLVVSPGSFSESLPTGETLVRTLTFENRGGEDLHFQLRIEAGGVPSPSAQQRTEASGVLLVQDAAPWGTTANEQILSANGIPFTVVGSAAFAATDLSTYRLVIVAGDQPTSFYAALSAQATRIEAYVVNGGVLEFHAAGWGRNGGDASVVTLPAGLRINPRFANVNYVLDAGHPLVAGVPNPFHGSHASHAYFTGIPEGASLVRTTLIATVRPRSVSLARYTSPIPPRPMSC